MAGLEGSFFTRQGKPAAWLLWFVKAEKWIRLRDIPGNAVKAKYREKMAAGVIRSRPPAAAAGNLGSGLRGWPSQNGMVNE